MRFYADLHVHSKHSVATSRNADLEGLARWARLKGVRVVGTGDFTHPAWFAEIREKLVPAEPGLFRLEPGLDREVERRVPAACRRPVRFALQVEISTIYKKGDRTRKVHHLVYAGDMETAAAFREALAAVGNIASDGRPILGLDSRHLLEIVLESGPDAFLVPAHVWTPWFAVLGSRSGFDSVEACYGDLADHVFAVETGLSSDPPMNWRVSGLDRFRLVSNSDAHSPRKLAREACVLETGLEYGAIRRAMETGRGLEGTLEFFPEEGKYHLDGHRKCGVCLDPDRTRALGGACPECGKPVTVGVLHRVEELADRPAGARPQGREPFRSLVPLPEIVAEVRDVGVDTKTVRGEVAGLLGRLGPELSVLADLPLEDVEAEADPLVAEGIRRLRAGDVRKEPGFDGRFGVVRLFDPGELRRQTTLGGLLEEAGDGEEAARPGGRAGAGADGAGGGEGDGEGPAGAAGGDAHRGESGKASGPIAAGGTGGAGPSADRAPPDGPPSGPAAAGTGGGDGGRILDALDPDQRRAATAADGPLLVVAGPGTGKTRTLTHRIAHQVAAGMAAPEACLTLTFTRRAAGEMRERLEALVPDVADRIPVTTFHGLGRSLLAEMAEEAGYPEGVRVVDERTCRELASELFGVAGREARRLLEALGRLRRQRALRSGTGGGRPGPGGSGDAGARAPGAGAPTARGTAAAPGGEAPEGFAGSPDREPRRRLRRWEEALRERGLVDFDGLLARPLGILLERPERREELRARWPRISIDEYQDVDALQYRLVRLLAPEGSDLCAIGDPDQSIYGFRGAEVEFFLRFREDWPGATVVRLTRSYRSAPAVVEAARQVIRPASLAGDRALEAVREDGPPRVVLQEARTAAAEAEFVVHTVERLVGGTSYFSLDSGRVAPGVSPDPGLSFSDVAVLYRTRDQEPPLVEALERSGLPFRRRSHRRLREREDVRALLEAFRGLRGDGAGEGAGHGSGAGDVDAPALLERAAEAAACGAPSGAGGEGGEDDGVGAGDGGLGEALRLLRPLAEHHRDPARFLDEVALGAEADAWDPRADRVSLLTLHAAKGLEFRVVFVVGCEDGLLPLRRGGRDGADDGEDLDEERRLLFVGMTRAGSRLYLSRARRRVRWGEALRPDPSPFLADVDARLLERRRGFGARADGGDGEGGPGPPGGGAPTGGTSDQLELL